jgi:hypothetical protein
MKFAWIGHDKNPVKDPLTLGPYFEIYNKFVQNNYEYTTNLDEVSDLKFIIVFDAKKKIIKKLRKKYTNIKLFLIVTEPYHINNKPWSLKYRKEFQKVFAFSTTWASVLGGISIPHPQNLSLKSSEEGSINSINRLVYIGSNYYSFNYGQKYHLRRKVINKLVKNGILIDTYGKNWNIPRHKEIFLSITGLLVMVKNRMKPDFNFSILTHRVKRSSKGVIDDKHYILNKYRFALIIENSDGYISEKIYDAIKAKCIPIYLGKGLPGRCITISENVTPLEINKLKAIMHDEREYRKVFNSIDFNFNEINEENSYPNVCNQLYQLISQEL